MEIKIYQIDTARDVNRICFLGYKVLPKYQKTQDIDRSIYDLVFEGCVEAQNLEDVYYIFNMRYPEGYCGRSLSVSDVVEVAEASGIEPGFYFCDLFGFERVEFRLSN